MTFKEVGEILGISPQRAEKIYQNALRKLSSPKNKDRWRKILETLSEIEKQRAESDSNTLELKKDLKYWEHYPK